MRSEMALYDKPKFASECETGAVWENSSGMVFYYSLVTFSIASYRAQYFSYFFSYLA